MLRPTVFFLLFMGLLSLGQGHHNNRALYDYDKIIDIEGIVTEVWYVNPHSRVYIEVTNENGETELWEGDLLDRGTLDRRGWKYNDLVAGDYVVASGRPARNRGFGLMLTKVFRPSDGWVGEGYRDNTGG